MAGRLKTLRYDFYKTSEVDDLLAGYLKIDGSNANTDIDIGTYDFVATDIAAINLTASIGKFNSLIGLFDITDEHYLNIAADSGKLGATNQLLLINVEDASRKITLTGDPTLDDWFDQSVKKAATPEFASIILPDENWAHTLTIKKASQQYDADRTLSMRCIGGDFFLWIQGDAKLDQDLLTNASPTFVTVHIDYLELGDDAPTAGNWIIDAAPATLDPIIGQDGSDGKGTNLICADGQASNFAGTSGDGGSVHIKIGTKGIGLNGAGDGVDGTYTVGDGGTTDYVEIDPTGDVNFVGGAGLVFGEIYAHGVTDAITSVAQNDWDQIVAFDTDGESNDTTPAHGTDDITILKAGKYLVSFQWSGFSAAVPHDWDFHISKNNNASQFNEITQHQTSSTASRLYSVSASAIITCAVNDTIELWVKRTTAGNNIVLTTTACNITVTQIGG